MKKMTRGTGLRSILRLRYLPAYLKDPSISPLKKGLLALAMIYIISPLDAIPEAIPIVGWLDDLGVLGILVASLLKELEDYGTSAGNG